MYSWALMRVSGVGGVAAAKVEGEGENSPTAVNSPHANFMLAHSACGLFGTQAKPMERGGKPEFYNLLCRGLESAECWKGPNGGTVSTPRRIQFCEAAD